MKTIPVSFLVAGMFLPALCLAGNEEPPMAPPTQEKGDGHGRGRPFAEAWKIADKDQDGLLSKEEFAALPRIQNLPEEKCGNLFKRLDKDGDGKLSRDELGRMGKRRDGPPGEPLQRLWELDADKSGGISIAEFKAGQLYKKLPPDKQDALFHRLDADGDGVITPKDRPEPPFKRQDGKSHPKHPDGKEGDKNDDKDDEKPKPESINRKLDLNGDGALSFDEFRAGPAVKNLTEDEQEDRFELIDRNDDSKLSAVDFE